MEIKKTSGGPGVLGAYKSFTTVVGRDYILTADVDKGSCNGNIEVNVKDVNNTVVQTQTITVNGVTSINIPFTALVAGNYTVEFIKVGGGNSPCEFFVDDVIVKYSRCADGLFLRNWHHFYVSNSSIISMVITDNTSGFTGARLYGPFNDNSFTGICDDIDAGNILPINQQPATSGTVSLASNLNQGWYLLEVIDEDCVGCIEIDVNEGDISCGLVCGDNSSCEDITHICENTQQTVSCSCINDNGGGQLWYEFDITNTNQIMDVNAILQATGNPTNFSYGIVGPLPENYVCDPADLQTNYLLDNGSTNSLSFGLFPSVGTYAFVLFNSSCGNPTSNDLVNINIAFTPALNCNPVTCPTDITINCQSFNPNLIINGDFEFGNAPETTTQISSDYTYQPNNTNNPGEGAYKIIQGPWTLTGNNLPVYNHTPSAGTNGYLMHLHDDLSNPNDFAWKKTITNIQPNTNYTFEHWFYLHQEITSDITNENINLYINGTIVASVDRSTMAPYEWHNIQGTWNSGNDTQAELKIEVVVNQGITNDDGRLIIDDISFRVADCSNCALIETNFSLNSSNDLTNTTANWDFGDNSPTSTTGTHTYTNPGTYQVSVTVVGPDDCSFTTSIPITIIDCIPSTPDCDNCIGSFSPVPDHKYVLSAWVKEEGAPLEKVTYDQPAVQMHFYAADHTEFPQIVEFKASGMIIDGWQRIEEEFFVPAPTAYIGIELVANGSAAYFDDIRVFPFDASMKSYVYDPINMRLAAELDERHYATFYEYDEEGKLIRVKKETEKGTMTIQETRNSTSK